MTDLEERLTNELGGVAYRFPPPSLTAVRERVARRRRARTARRVVGAAAAVVLVAGTVAVLTGNDRTSVSPAPAAPSRQMCGSGSPPGDDEPLTAADAGPVLWLPQRAPAGLPYGMPYLYAEPAPCGDHRDLTAWTEDPGTRRITRWLHVGSAPYGPEPGTGCERFDGNGQMPGTCRDLVFAGESRKVLWSDAEPGPTVRWQDDDGRLWTVFSYGFDEPGFKAAVRDFRLADGRVGESSLPRGMDVWAPPADRPADGLVLSTFFGTGTTEVFFGVESSPLADPFGHLRDYGYGPATRLEVVDVGGRAAYWKEAGEPGEGPDNELVWRGEDGVTLSLGGDGLTKSEALAVAASVRKVPPDDPRLVMPPRRTG